MKAILYGGFGAAMLIGFGLKALLNPEQSAVELTLRRSGHHGEAVAVALGVLAILFAILVYQSVRFVRTTARLHVLKRQLELMQEAQRRRDAERGRG